MLHYGIPGIPGTEGGGPVDPGATAAQHRRSIPVPRSPVTETDPADSTAVAAFRDFIFFTVFQPIVDLATGEPVGCEALCRFADGRSLPAPAGRGARRSAVAMAPPTD